jgi:hypothetical protein
MIDFHGNPPFIVSSIEKSGRPLWMVLSMLTMLKVSTMRIVENY